MQPTSYSGLLILLMGMNEKMTDKKWYFDTIEEAKEAMPEWDGILTTSPPSNTTREPIDTQELCGSKPIPIEMLDLMRHTESMPDKLKIFNELQKTTRQLLSEFNSQQDSKMTLQNQAKELLPFVQAMAEGKEVQVYCNEAWVTKSTPDFIHGLKYRIAPETIIVNGFEIEAPMKEAPEVGELFYFADPSEALLFDRTSWNAGLFCVNALSRGLCHKTRAAAIAHSKAMIGVDPNK